MLDRQSIYHRVAAHLREQGEPAVVRTDAGLVCAYRTLGGLSCAIGILIADEVFDPDLNATPVCDPAVIAMLADSGFEIDMASDDAQFLADLQATHDGADPNAGDWLAQVIDLLEEFRRGYGLGDSTAAEVRDLTPA